MFPKQQKFEDRLHLKTSNWKHKYCFHVIPTSCSSQNGGPRHIDLKVGEGAGSKKYWFYSIIDKAGSQKKNKVKTIYHNRLTTLIKDSNIAVLLLLLNLNLLCRLTPVLPEFRGGELR